jgi:hypothetical protein
VILRRQQIRVGAVIPDDEIIIEDEIITLEDLADLKDYDE